MNILFSPPDITEKEIQAVADVLRSGWITTGPKTKQFEKLIADYCGVKKVACLNSQTACAEMALRILGVSEGDEVITTAYTYTATASVICHVGATPIIVDTKKDSLEMDYAAVENAITDKTKAIIGVDVAGIPSDYDRIYNIVENNKSRFIGKTPIQRILGRIAVIADAAHSFGAEYRNKRSGSIADFSAFSFHAVKNLTTAEGGALTWRNDLGFDDDEIYRQIQLLSLHGQSKDALSKTQAGKWEYDVLGTYYKCNMTDIVAAVGCVQFERYDTMLNRRREIIKIYDAAFNNDKISVLKHFANDYRSSGHLYITRVNGIDEKIRSAIIEDMASKGVACNVHYKPLPLLTAYKNLGFDINCFPNAYSFYRNEITLPLHTKLTDEEVEYVIKSYTETVNKYV